MIKDDTNKQHKYDLDYFSRCPFTTCTDNYIRETTRRLNEHVVDNADRHMKSQIVRSSLNNDHETVNVKSFKNGKMGYYNNTYRRRISETLFVKQYRPSLNA